MSVPKHLRPDPSVSETRLSTASGELAALVATPDLASSKPGALLVPGYTGSKEDFWHVLPLLAQGGRPATAIDLRGQHESGGPEDIGAYTTEALAADVSQLLAEAAEPLHLVAHSFGGLVCRAAVLAGAPVRSLTLLGSGPSALGGNRAALVEVMRPLLAEGGVAKVWEATSQMNAAQTAAQPQEVAALIERRFLASPAAALLGMGHELVTAPDLVDELAATGVPILVACGANDDAWSPEDQKDMAARLGAQYVVFADAGHSPNVDAPEAVVDALEAFWKTLE